MLKTLTLLAVSASYLVPLADARKVVSIFLSASEQSDVGPLYTVTVGQEDYTFPDTQAGDFKDDDALVWETIPVGDLSFAKAGHLTFDNKAPRDIQFWIREGDKDTPTRHMTKCWISLSSSPEYAEDGEMKLYLAPKGEYSMFEGQIVDPGWLNCTQTDLFELPVALTEDD